MSSEVCPAAAARAPAAAAAARAAARRRRAHCCCDVMRSTRLRIAFGHGMAASTFEQDAYQRIGIALQRGIISDQLARAHARRTLDSDRLG
jgi:hypothetical protein